ncbi:hypothetical protein TWF696_001728 [Orbilia brochopaga]|uniref:VASt domain-containing protein n=1 Tax=Orbilia brochopaga TaxID=3140254 RepID=A0AAV9U9Q2_9PEZI
MPGSTTSLSSSPQVPSITTTVSVPDSHSTTSGSPISRALSRAKKKKSSQNLSISDNQSSLSLSSTENASVKSSTSVIDKIRKRRAERKERKEAAENNGSLFSSGDGTPAGPPASKRPSSSRRNSVTGSLDSLPSTETTDHDGVAITFEPGLVALEPGSKALAATPTFPISISTSFEDPSLSSRSTQLQVTSDGKPVRRSTSPAHSSGSRDSSPTPGGASTPTVASGIVIGNILGLKGKKRSDSTNSNTSGSGPDDAGAGAGAAAAIATAIASSVPRSSPTGTSIINTAMATDAALNLTKPDTVVTPPTPIEPAVAASAAPNIIARRARGSSVSKVPSRLSQSTYPEEGSKPLTPTIEVPTPQQTPTVGTAAGGGNAATGFFSNMFSAAQTAASQLSNTIANTSLAPGGKTKKGGEPAGSSSSINTGGLANAGEDSTPSQSNTPSKVNLLAAADEKDRKPLAVETLGQGELSLGSLGITSPAPAEARNRRSVGIEMPEPALLHGLGLTGEKDEEIGQIPKSAGGALQDKSFDTVIYEKSTGTPSQVPVAAEETEHAPVGRQRSDSGRSILGRHGSRKKRDRGASAATQGSDTPIIPIVRTTTTFAAASHRRNKDFHTLFKSVPSDDQLIEDYGCALQKEILLQGRMYVSSGHICFHSNIFGWVTTLVISFDEIVAIERKNTALVIPNAIMIQTLHARNVFASFISRDSTYDLILGIWRTIHPNLIDTVNGTRLGDEKDDNISEEPEDEDGSEYGSDEDYDSIADDSEPDAVPAASEASAIAKSVAKKASTPAVGSAAAAANAANGSADAGAGAAADFPGPATHAPTLCGDETAHLDRALCDETIAAPLGKVFSAMYGTESFTFLTRLLTEDVKVEQLSIPNEGKFADSADYPGKKARSFNYIKPLNASIGPRSTKCLITEVVEQEDLEKAVTVVTYTQTPDVPSGSVFKVLTRTCLMWGDGGGTRIIMNCTVEWSGKSWIKGPIEKGASDGQISYTKDLLNALRREFAKGKAAAAGKGRRKRREGRDVGPATAIDNAAPAPAAATAVQKWGVLAPVMEPITALVGEFGAGILVTLVLVLFAMSVSRAIFGDGAYGRGHGGLRKTEREILQEMWLREEAGLWEWLEDRAGVDAVLGFDERVSARYGKEAGRMREAMRVQSDGRLDERMVERQVDEAIRVSEERLGVLKRVNEEKKMKRRGGGCGCSKRGAAGCGCAAEGKACTCTKCACGARERVQEAAAAVPVPGR